MLLASYTQVSGTIYYRYFMWIPQLVEKFPNFYGANRRIPSDAIKLRSTVDSLLIEDHF
jgi:hypothetical protein